MEELKPSTKKKPLTAAATVEPQSLLRRLIDLDATWSLHIHTICQPIPRSILKALEISGDGRFWFPIPIALVYLCPPLRPFLLLLLIGSFLDLLVVGFLKFLFRRPRPVYNRGMHLIVAVDHWSFPSGHSSRVSFVAAFLYLCCHSLSYSDARLLFGSHDHIVVLLVPAVCTWAAMTSVSRVLLGRHFVFDVIAGSCLGLIEALFALQVRPEIRATRSTYY